MMNKKLFLLSAYLFLLTACGVKGNPLPPLEPPFIGRGKPTFNKGAEPKNPLLRQSEWDKASEEEDSNNSNESK